MRLYVIPAGTLRIDKGAVFTPGIDEGVQIEVPVEDMREPDVQTDLEAVNDGAATRRSIWPALIRSSPIRESMSGRA